MTMSSSEKQQHLVATTDDVTIVDYVYVDAVSPAVETVVHQEEVVVKPSFIDVLKLNLNPSLEFEDERKIKRGGDIRRSNNNDSGTRNTVTDILRNIDNNQAVGDSNVDLRPLERVAVSAAERRVLEARSAKDGIGQRIGIKQADCDEAKCGLEAAVSNEESLRGLLKAKNVEISEAQSELKILKSSGVDFESMLQQKGLVILKDGLTSILGALSSSGIGVQDLDWTALVDELLKPMKIEVDSLKENIKKAEVTTKTSKKNYDNRTVELMVLKAQLKKAEVVFQEANRELMKLQNKDISEENGDLITDREDENQAKDESHLPCNGKMDLDRQVNETCKEDVGNNNKSEKTVENNITSVDQTMEPDETSEPEVGCKSDEVWNLKEVGHAGEGDLVEEAKNEEELKQVELSKIEHVEQDTEKDEIHNGTPASTEPQMKKKPNKRERRALEKARLLSLMAEVKEEIVCVEQTVVHTHSSNIKHEYERNSEQGEVNEQVLNTEEIDDTLSEDEVEKVESSETDDNHNYLIPRKKFRNKKKQKKEARKARRARARAAELQALEGNGDGMPPMNKLPQVSFAIIIILLVLILWPIL